MTQFDIVALKALFGSPSVVPSLHDDVDLLVAVLAHVSTEYPAPAVAGDRVSAVNRAAPHVPDAVRVHLGPRVRVTQEWVIGRDPVGLSIRGFPIHINAEGFSQQSTPGSKKQNSATVERRQLKRTDGHNACTPHGTVRMISRGEISRPKGFIFSENLSENFGTLLVLRVSVLPERIPSFSAVSGEDVQISIETKQDLASVVVGGRLFDFQNDP